MQQITTLKMTLKSCSPIPFEYYAGSEYIFFKIREMNYFLELPVLHYIDSHTVRDHLICSQVSAHL